MSAHLNKHYVILALLVVVLFSGFIYLENNKLVYSLQVNHKNDLSTQTLQLLQSLDSELMLEVYTQKETLIAKKVKKFFQAYLRHTDKISIVFIDPIENPTKVKQNAISMQGELILSNPQGKQVHITELSESAIDNAIVRISNLNDEWIIFAEGYGMLQVDDASTRGLSSVLVYLKKIGFHIARMPLNTALILPENVKLIILPAPQQPLDNAMLNWLQNQMDSGISLLWLNDVDDNNQTGLELLTDVMSADKKQLQADKYVGLIADYPKNLITENFNQPIYLADVRAIIPQSPQHQNVILQSQDNSPLAVSRQLESTREIVIGDSDFISNQYINMAANKSFLVRMIDWLMYHDNRVNVPIQINKPTQLLLSQTELLLLSLVFLLLMPSIFLIIAFKQWRAGRE